VPARKFPEDRLGNWDVLWELHDSALLASGNDQNSRDFPPPAVRIERSVSDYLYGAPRPAIE
jgi:hypothetical protein